MKDNKDVIRQILLDFDRFKTPEVWLCSFDEIVEEFIATQSEKYSINKGE